MKKTIIILTILFIFSGCSLIKTTKEKEIDYKAPTIVYVDEENRIAVFTNGANKNNQFLPTTEEALKANEILEKCFNDIKKDILNGTINRDEAWIYNAQKQIQEIEFKKYGKQFIGTINSQGEKVIHATCIATNDASWKKQKILLDGGMAYFEIDINLDKEECSNFYPNGYS